MDFKKMGVNKNISILMRFGMTHGKQNSPHPDDQIWSPPSMQYDSSHSTVSKKNGCE
jgi:hypothetical protein